LGKAAKNPVGEKQRFLHNEIDLKPPQASKIIVLELETEG
jgi:hypothetical protein